MTEQPAGRVALAATYDPRGEIPRLQRFYPLLQAAYSAIIITLPPHTSPADLAALHALPGAILHVVDTWAIGRYTALKLALTEEAEHIHYNDLDRLLRWVETRPDEWRGIVARVRAADCLIVGRTPAAYATHPQALIHTEAVANRTVAHLLGLPQPIDLSAGSKGFSRRAAALLVTHARPDQPMGADAEWPVLLHRFGLTIDYTEVDGLDWETADRSRPSAASRADQQALADALDADPGQWAARVAIAREIIEAGLEASQRALEPG